MDTSHPSFKSKKIYEKIYSNSNICLVGTTAQAYAEEKNAFFELLYNPDKVVDLIRKPIFNMIECVGSITSPAILLNNSNCFGLTQVKQILDMFRNFLTF